LSIPVYSIGAGIDADGQLMISSDVAGVFQAFTPKFVKKYENLADKTIQAFSAYKEDVKEGRFPAPEHTYRMVEGELDKLTAKLN
jgi:3-methyl-2-oxobutanoate hydroxymethyltransferase